MMKHLWRRWLKQLTNSALGSARGHHLRKSKRTNLQVEQMEQRLVPAITAVDLSTYVRVGRFDLPEPTRTTPPANSLLAQEASAVTYNWDTDTLFVVGDGGTSIVQVSKTGQLIDSMTLAPGSSPQGTDFYDTEGLTYVGAGKFVLMEERYRQANFFTYVGGGVLHKADVQTVKLGTTVGNIGLEGISYDPLTGGFICVKEKDPESIFQTGIDFAAGTATNGSPSSTSSTDLFNPALANLSDFSDVFAISNLSVLNGQPDYSHLLIISQESGQIVNVDRSGTVFSTLTITGDPGNPLSVPDQTNEGVTMDGAGNVYVVNENGGGDSNHPQLWVYAPTTATNLAPTAVTLANAVASIPENTSTAAPVKVADIVVTDDGLGNNKLTLTGTDTAFFHITGTALYLNAGTVLNSTTKPSYSVTVNVDDPAVGSTPDLTKSYSLAITASTGGTASLIISEVAPWSSGSGGPSSGPNSLRVDWFEVTNIGTAAANITGWKMDDNSNSFGSAVALNGISSIAPGESVIFMETADLAGKSTAFKSLWFGANPPPNLHFGSYSGSGVGLSTDPGDAVNLFDASGTVQAKVVFGLSPTGPSFPTFDNAAGLNNATISALSAVGINGAFAAANDVNEIGSPGTVGAPPTPTISIVATDATAAEAGANPGTFRVSRTGSTVGALTVSYTMTTGAGQATSADYTPALTGSATIPSGQSFVDITITPVEDSLIEGSENLTLKLGDSGSYDVGASGTATVSIADNAVGVLPFLGVAAGDADSSSAVVWTRVNQQANVPVHAQLSTDPGFGGTLLTFAATSDSTKDYTVKLVVGGLTADTRYYFRFVIDATSATSNTGTFKTAPAASAQVPLKFAFSGDMDGFMRPYALSSTVPAQGLDFYLNLGDVIYETASNVAGNNGASYLNSPTVTLSGSSATLNGVPTSTGFATQQQLFDDYNKKYREQFLAVNTGGQNGLQDFYAGQGNYTLPDNHELGNRQYINGGAPAGGSVGGPTGIDMPTGRGVDARANGTGNPGNANDTNTSASDYMNRSQGYLTLQQDFLNYQPVRENRANAALTTATISAPTDPRTDGTKQLYFSQPWGQNGVYIQTDTRSYRDLRLKTANGAADDTGARADNPNRTYLGATQLAWLEQQLLTAEQNGTPWKFVTLSDPIDEIGPIGSSLSSVTAAAMQPFSGNAAYGPVNADGGKSYVGGYRAERNALLKFIADHKIENVVFLATDDHQNRINEVTYSPSGTTDIQSSYVPVPHVFSIVCGPLGATGPDLFLNHDFASVQGAANLIANAQTAAGVEPIGLMGYQGLHDVKRDQNGTLVSESTPQAADFYSPDTFNYNILEVSADGKTLTVTSKGINSTPQNSALEYGANGNTVRTLFSFQVDAFNEGPVAVAGSVTTNEDTAKSFAVGDFHFSDLENNALASITVSNIALASGDTLTVNQGLGAVAVTNGMTITAAQISTLTYSPAANASGPARSQFSFTVNDGGPGANAAVMTINVIAVADAPNLAVTPAAGIPGVSIPLDIQASLVDTDGSETLAITISGVPAGASLSQGTDQTGGVWTLTPSQLIGLKLNGAATGMYTLHVVATATESSNASSASKSADLSVLVSGSSLINGVLTILGTMGSDVVAIDHGSHNQIIVTASFFPGTHTQTFNTSVVTRVVVLLLDGNDVALVDDDVKVPTLLDGGRGNDVLQGGGGDTVILGGEGNDILSGGKHRDILIGGVGIDTTLGRGGQDILVGGSTNYDTNADALFAALAEWSRDDLDLTQRMAHLRTGGGLNGSTVLTSSTVHDDADFDILSGGSGNDWYWAGLTQDLIVGKKKKEVVN